MDGHVERYRKRRDSRVRKRLDEENWITIKGTHVFIDENGEVSKGPDGLKKAVGKKGTGKPLSLNDLGLKRESGVDVDLFDFFDTKSGRYNWELANEMDEFGGDGLLVSCSDGGNKAYASLDEEGDTLEGIVSTGGGMGTKLLKKVMEYQKSRGKGLMWMADKRSAVDYYKHLGFSKYVTSKSPGSVLYEVKPEKMEEAINQIKGKT